MGWRSILLFIVVTGVCVSGCTRSQDADDKSLPISIFEETAVEVINLQPIRIESSSTQDGVLSLPIVQGNLDGSDELLVATFDGYSAPKSLVDSFRSNSNGTDENWADYSTPDEVWQTSEGRKTLTRVSAAEWDEGGLCNPFVSVGNRRRRVYGKRVPIPWPDGSMKDGWPTEYDTPVAEEVWAGYAAFDPLYQFVLVSLIGPVVQEKRDEWGEYVLRKGPYYIAVVDSATDGTVSYVLFNLEWDKVEAGVSFSVTPDGRWAIALAGTREAMWLIPLWKAAESLENDDTRRSSILEGE